MNQIYARKVGMTRIFTEAGESVGVTVLEAWPHVVTQVKTAEKEGYAAVQVAFCEQKPQRVNRARGGQFKAAKRGSFRHLRELRFGPALPKQFAPGDEIRLEAETFVPGSKVDVSGVSIGKGFAGVIRRHKMAGFPKTRGTHEFRRHGGAIGCRKFPGRVFKNKRMPGHMGVDNVTQHGIEVVGVRPEQNLLLVRGSIPGPKNGVVLVRSAVKSGK